MAPLPFFILEFCSYTVLVKIILLPFIQNRQQINKLRVEPSFVLIVKQISGTVPFYCDMLLSRKRHLARWKVR